MLLPAPWLTVTSAHRHIGSPSRRLTATSTPRCLTRLLATQTQARQWYSPSDLTTFAESPWVSWLERLAREVPSHRLVGEADAPDAFLQMLGRKGDESEAAVLSAIRAQGQSIIDLSDVRGSPLERVAATAHALADAPDVIYQAPLSSGRFFGVADFLVRIDTGERPGTRLPAQYMVWDAKLSR